MYSRVSSFGQYNICIDISRDCLERGYQTTVGWSKGDIFRSVSRCDVEIFRHIRLILNDLEWPFYVKLACGFALLCAAPECCGFRSLPCGFERRITIAENVAHNASF